MFNKLNSKFRIRNISISGKVHYKIQKKCYFFWVDYFENGNKVIFDDYLVASLYLKIKFSNNKENKGIQFIGK